MPNFFGCSVSIAVCFVMAVPLWPAEMPVKEVTLYKHGVGFFEREGVVNAGEELRLDFQNNDMNDVLKSLTVTDLSGGRIAAVRYDSNETPEQRLSKFPFQVGETELLSTFLDRLKGSRLELKTADRTVAGSILGARALPSSEGDRRLTREQVTILLDSGDLASYDLGSVSSFRLLDPRLQEELKQYLQTLGQSRSREKRSVYIESDGKDARHLRASYITPTPIWKSSYRLTLDEANTTLEGWAIVDNTTGEDWNNVQLAVVSGRPISFISLLDVPRYGKRDVAELPEDRAAGPRVYGGTMSDKAELDSNAAIGAGSGAGYGAGGGAYRTFSGTAQGFAQSGPPKQFLNESLTKSKNEIPSSMSQTVEVNAEVSSVAGATGETLGELFEYTFPGPVTIKKSESAMLPFLQDKVKARKLLIYTFGHDDEHPVNAAELTNTCSKTLDGGPMTVFDAGAYAGEALFETMKAGDKRLIGYAVDYGTRVEQDSDSGNQSVREVHVRNGNIEIRYAQHETRTYSATNVDSKPKTLIIEQENGSYSLISPKPIEKTAKADRFELKLPANGSGKLTVEQEEVTSQTYVVANSTPDFLVSIVSNRQLSPAARTGLQSIADLKSRLAETNSALSSSKSALDDLTADQTRLRANIDSLNRVKGQEDQVRKYSGQLSDNEAQIAKLRDQRRDLELTQAKLNGQLRDEIQKLDF